MIHTPEVNAPHIWTRRPKIWEPRAEILGAGPKLCGFYKMEAVRPDGRRRLLADWFPNLITNGGLNVIGTSASWLTWCRVGTGSTTPANTDAALASHLAETSSTQSTTPGVSGSPPYYGSWIKVWRFAQGVAAGNLAEVGVADQAVSSPTDVLFSRALILDSSGDPTTITVLSDEFLDVTYQLRTYAPASDVVHVVNISGTDYTVTERAANVTTAAQWTPNTAAGWQGGLTSTAAQVYANGIGAITGEPSGTSSAVTTTTQASYGNNNLYRDTTLVWSLAAGNISGGIGAARIALGETSNGRAGNMQYDFSPKIPKTSSQILSLVFRHTWGRGQS